jgi:hypothetical protein
MNRRRFLRTPAGAVHTLFPILAAIAVGLASLAAAYSVRPPVANAQRTGTPSLWEYRVRVLSYNPGERLTDDQCRALYEPTINEEARGAGCWSAPCSTGTRSRPWVVQ